MLKRALKWVVYHATGHLLTNWVLPFAFPVGAIVIGYAQNMPWFWIYVGAVLAAAGGMSSLIRYSDWRIRNNIADNLAFTSGRLAFECSDTGVLERIRFGVVFTNQSVFALSFRVEEMSTSLGSFYSPNKPRDDLVIDAPPGGIGWVDDFDISVPVKISPGWHEGHVLCKVSFGRLGALIHTLEIKQKVSVLFDHNGTVVQHLWSQG